MGLFISATGSISAASAYYGQKRVIQFSGVVVDASDLAPIPFATVQIKGTNRGVVANSNGFFTFVATTGDVIQFSCMGYSEATFKIEDTLSHAYYSVVQSLVQDTIMLTETIIYPWPSKEKFREEFVNLRLPETEADILRKNFTLAAMREQVKSGKMDASMNYQSVLQQRVGQLYYQGQIAPNNLFNPFAWAQFVKRLKAQKKQDKIQEQVGEYEEYGKYEEE